MNRDILCASLSLSLCVFYFISPIRRYFFSTDSYRVISSALTAFVQSQQLVSELGCPSSRYWPPFQPLEHNILFFGFAFEETEKRREEEKRGLHLIALDHFRLE